MDENNRPKRRRELSDKERENLSRQQQKERELLRKNARREAKIREQARAEARKNGRNPHIVVEIPAAPEKKIFKRPKRKTLPDIIERETDKKVRNMDPTDHGDGYYVNEVGVRKETARKQKERRKKALPKQISPKQRRRRRIIAYSSIVTAVMIIGIILSLTVLFKAENIVVKGNEYYEDSLVIELSGVNKGDNIFTASFFANTDELVDTLPYVKSAKVGFSIPDGLIITVKNYEPYYSLKSGDNYYLISENNRILEKVDKKPEKLMFIEAPNLKNAEIGDYVEFSKERYTKAVETIIESLHQNGYTDVTAISVKNINDIKITYDNRILIKLGLPDDIDYKIRTAFTIITKKLDPNNAKSIMGILNVSNCNNGSKKSYFREVAIMEEETKATTAPTTEPATEPISESEAALEDDYYYEYDTDVTDAAEEITYYDDLYGYYDQEASERYYGGGDDSNEEYVENYDENDYGADDSYEYEIGNGEYYGGEDD